MSGLSVNQTHLSPSLPPSASPSQRPYVPCTPIWNSFSSEQRSRHRRLVPTAMPSLLPQVLPILQWMDRGWRMCVGPSDPGPPPSWEATRGENYVSRARLGHLRTGNHPHSPSGSSVNPDTAGSMLSPFSSPQERGQIQTPGPGSSTHHPIPDPNGSPSAMVV